jgi:hypothetical protein
MDISEFGGSDPVIHFVETHTKIIRFWPYYSAMLQQSLSMDQKQVKQ